MSLLTENDAIGMRGLVECWQKRDFHGNGNY